MAELSPSNNPGVGREFVFKRTFNAPRDLVFQVWTQAEHVAKWWGPNGFTNPVCVWDAKPGNPIHLDMTAPDGSVNVIGGNFHEVVPPERLVFSVTAFPDETGEDTHEVHNTVNFAELGDKTEMTMTVVIKRIAPDMIEALEGMNEGWNQSLDRVEEVLAQL